MFNTLWQISMQRHVKKKHLDIKEIYFTESSERQPTLQAMRRIYGLLSTYLNFLDLAIMKKT